MADAHERRMARADAAFRHGWQPPEGPIDWSDDDWVLRRLLAVCSLVPSLSGSR